MPLRRRRGDPEPTEPVAVLLASSGRPFSMAALRRAEELAAGDSVAVLTIVRVYGSSFGLPNPGLMPTKKERDEQLRIVRSAVDTLERRGVTVDAQVATTRSAGRTIARMARRRQARAVVMDASSQGRARRMLEGDVARIVRFLLRGQATLEIIPPDSEVAARSRR